MQTAQVIKVALGQRSGNSVGSPQSLPGSAEGAPMYVPRRYSKQPSSEADAIPRRQQYQAWGPQVSTGLFGTLCGWLAG